MQYDEIITIVTKILETSGISYTSVDVATDHELATTIIAVQTPEHGLFTYRDGELIKAINHLVRRILETKYSDRDTLPHYILDVNNEHTKYLASLKDKVRSAVERVQQHKMEVELEPMSAYDRLMVHSFVGSFDNVGTHSTGEGFERRVVLSYQG